MASTSDRKLPEIFAADVVAAERSLMIEKASSDAKRARSQSALSAVRTARPAAAASAASSRAIKVRDGRRRPCRGYLQVGPARRAIGPQRARLEGASGRRHRRKRLASSRISARY